MSAKYKSPSFLLPNELNTSANTANDTGINSLYSMDFDSTTKIPNITGLGLGTSVDTFSISLWFNKSNMNYGIVFSTYSGSGTYPSTGVAIDLNTNGTIAFYNGANRTTTSAQYSINTWYNLVVTSDGTTVKMYVNGSQVTLDSTTVVARNFTNVWINSAKYSSDNFGITGKIDEVAIFNRALESTEISALYDGSGSNIRPSNLMATNLNPIAYYPLGEQAQMQGYLGNEASSEWQFPNGVLQDYVMDFDGSNKINLGNSIGDIGTSPMSFSFWVNFAATSQIQTVLSNINSANDNGWKIEFAANSASILFMNRDSGTFISCPYSLYDVWTNIIIVRNGAANNKIYINGQSQILNTNTENLTNIVSTDDLVIGSQYYNNAYYRYFNGQMSNVAIWNTAITDANQIANIYNNGSPQTTYTVTPQNWWKLNATSVYTPSAPNYTTALDFNNVPTAVQGVIYSPTSLPSTSAWSVSFWAVRESSNQKKWLWSAGSSSNGAGIFNESGQLRFTGTAAGDISMGSTPFAAGDVFHMAASYDGSILKVYIDGSEFYSGSVTTNISTDYIIVGGWNRYGYPTGAIYYGYSQNDIMSNFAVWDSALTSSQVSTLFNFGTPETNISFSPRNYYKLDNTTTGLNDLGLGGANAFISGTGITQVNSSVAVVPSWKIPTALPIATPNYTTALEYDSTGNGEYSLIPFSSNKTIDAISLWYNSSAAAGTLQYLISFTNSFSSFEYPGLSINQPSYGDLLFVQTWPTNYVSYTGGELSGWNNLVINYNTSTLKYDMYLNGLKLSTSTTGAGTDKVSTNGLLIGNRGALYVPFKGFISNLCIFNSSLNETGSNSIETIYNAGTPLTSMSGFTSLDGWWTLKDTSTSTGGGLYDSSSNSNNASANTASQGTSDVLATQPVNGVSTTLPSTALQQSDLQFDSPYSNYSLNFDGTGDYIDCTDISYFSGADRFSLSTWFKVTDDPSTNTNRDIISKGTTTSGTTSFFIRKGKNTNLNKISLSFNEGTINVPGTTQLQNNVWYHLTVVYKGYESNNADRAKIYINGVDDTASYTNTVPTTLVSSTQPLRIGRWATGTDFYGNIDETAIWQSALTDAQVLQVYNNGRPSDITSLSPNYWWRLGENAYFNDVPAFTVPNSITGAPNGTGSGSITSMISADAPGTYANGIGTNLSILDRVGDAPLSTSNSQSYNMIPSDISPYVPSYVGDQIANAASMTFDSASSTYFDAGNDVSLQFSSSFSISAWVKINLNDTGTNAIISKDSNISNGSGYHIDFRSGNQVHAWSYDANSKLIATGLSTNTWYHIVFVFESTGGSNGNQSLYINAGTPVTNTTTNFAASTIKNLRIGGSEVLSSYTDGQIDEVAIFNYALTADQIKFDIYEPTKSGTGLTANLDNNPNLTAPVAWYRMGD